MTTPLTNAQRQAQFKKRRDAKHAKRDAELALLVTEMTCIATDPTVKTIQQARQIARNALGVEG
jgi:hypothetical protein